MIAAFKKAQVGVLLVTLWIVWGLAFVFGDVLPVNDGLGWDGVRFAKMVERGPGLLPAREINRYYIQRVGPSFAVRGLLQAVGVPLETSGIRAGFVALNLGLLSLALVMMMDAARRVGLSPVGRWILFLGLFVNPANGRLPIYYAPIGDSTAFFIGALIAWSYIARRPLVMTGAFLLSIVCWPAAFLFLPLLIWPRAVEDASLSLPARPSRGVGIAAAPLGLLLLTLLSKAVEMPDIEAWSRDVILAVSSNSLVLGCAAGWATALLFLNARRVLQLPSGQGVAAAIALIALSRLYVQSFESGSLAFGADTFAREMILFARSGVFAAMIGHAAYYAGLAVAAAVLWPEVLRRGLSLGPGAFIALALSGLIAFDAESRRLSAYWPLVALVTVMVLEPWLATRARLLGLAAAFLLLSRIWWPMTGPLLFAAAHEPGNYFNTQGPSMSDEARIAHGLAVLALGLWIWAGRGFAVPEPRTE